MLCRNEGSLEIPTPLDAMGIKVGVGYGGIFDFQRSGNSFYGNYTYASNYAVGILMNGAHYSLESVPDHVLA